MNSACLKEPRSPENQMTEPPTGPSRSIFARPDLINALASAQAQAQPTNPTEQTDRSLLLPRSSLSSDGAGEGRPTTLDFVERIIAVAAEQMADALATYAAAVRQISQFVVAVLFFHVSEYLLAILFHGRSNVSWSSLLISKHYVIAMGFALVEYTVEIILFPQLKEFWFVSNCGLVMILIGEVIRKAAIITAGRAFTHLIRIYYEDQHVLVTHGIYSIMRHPSYCGFFIWAVGTQVMLCNPVSVVAFVLVIWRFFSRRIPYEEFFLRQFFGREYIEYAQKVPSGLPFIK